MIYLKDLEELNDLTFKLELNRYLGSNRLKAKKKEPFDVSSTGRDVLLPYVTALFALAEGSDIRNNRINSIILITLSQFF